MNLENLMKECIELALKGMGNVSPNPLVGAIVLDKDNKIISRGFHQKYGENHAERNALTNLDNCLTKNGTLVVNLEPCSHFGKTPPCADLIIEKGIKKVIIGMKDVNPIVSGNGIKKLKAAGIEVIDGILEDECKKLNEVFIKNMTEKKTFVAIKTATTLDGKIATCSGDSKWITSENARQEVKNIRNVYDAILTSSSTILSDNPRMLHKKKVILDRTLKTNFKESEIYKTGECHIFYDSNLNSDRKKILETFSSNSNLHFHPISTVNNKIDIEELLNTLYSLGIMSVLVEAGGRLNGSFLSFADKIYHFIAPKIVGDNSALSCFDYRNVQFINESRQFKFDESKLYLPDILLVYSK